MNVNSEPMADIVERESKFAEQFAEQFKQALKQEKQPSKSYEEAAEIAATEKAKQEKQRTRRMKQDIKLRKRYSKKIDFLVVIWVIFIAWILVSAGLKTIFLPFMPPDCLRPFSLDNSVLIALISGASINIIGLMVIVARYLFPSGDKTKCRNYEE